MSAAMIDPQSWRRPGCDERCQLLVVITVGVMRRELQELHDPDAHEEYATALATGSPHLLVRTGPLTIDLTTRRADLPDREVGLTPREWQMLEVLVRARGGYRSLVEIACQIWPGVIPGSGDANTIRTIVHRLRASLGSAGYLIQTRQHGGYRLAMVPPIAQEVQNNG